MSITKTNKELSTSTINCQDSFQVTLSLTAEPDIISNPTDIVLILDRSGSMTGEPLTELKVATNHFIDIIAATTGGTQSGEIGYGSHIGIVSFATTANQDTQLITSVAMLKNAVNSLTAGGATNHADAFTKAEQLFANSDANEKIMIMFTDGFTTQGNPAKQIADAIKAQGIQIYCIGLNGSGGIDVQALEDWASDPSSTYVAITPNADELDKIFEEIAKNITSPGATEIEIIDEIASCFTITSIVNPNKGTASLLDSNHIKWEIETLGATASEDASLTFNVKHTGNCQGSVFVNEGISYTDKENHQVIFPDPTIFVDCPDKPGYEEPCPTPINFVIEGCHDTIEFDGGSLALQSLGRIVSVDVTLTNVCPHKRVALAVILTEYDEQGIEHKRGTKYFTIPAHTMPSCRNILVKCIKFVLPESENSSTSLCKSCDLNVRFIAHYIDFDFDCCGNLNIQD